MIENPLVQVDKCPTCHRKQGERHKATTKSPSLKTMERWMDSGIARATDGCKVEPDGTCPHGHQSWIMRLGFINPIRNTVPMKGVGTRRFEGQPYYYAGRTIYPTKAYSVAQELRGEGIKSKITRSKDMGSLIWTSRPVYVDLSEPLYNPSFGWHWDRSLKLQKEMDDPNFKNWDEWNKAVQTGKLNEEFLALRHIGENPTFRVGQRVYIKPDDENDYYSGEGTVKEIRVLEVQFSPTGPKRRQKMVAVHFTGKGTLWFEPKSVKSAKNPTVHPQALESLKRYKEDLKAGHKGGAEYWRGAAAAYFTANPESVFYHLYIKKAPKDKWKYYGEYNSRDAAVADAQSVRPHDYRIVRKSTHSRRLDEMYNPTRQGKVYRIRQGKDSYGTYVDTFYEDDGIYIWERNNKGENAGRPFHMFSVALQPEPVSWIGLFNTYDRAKAFYADYWKKYPERKALMGKNPLAEIAAGAVTGLGLGLGFGAASWATKRFLKNPQSELNIGLTYYQERQWISAIKKYGQSILDKSLLSKGQKSALIRQVKKENIR